MYNWSVNLDQIKKYPQKYRFWRLEQLINFGLGEEKLEEGEVRENLSQLHLDPLKRRYMEFLLS